jgi:hypothetical protein
MATFDTYALGATNFGRTLSDVIPSVPNINVRYFYDSTAGAWKGATGDGTTDDYTVIAAAITEAATSAGPNIVYFPAGQYKVGTTLSVQDVQVIASPYAEFIPGVLSMTMVEMKKNSSWFGGYFNARGLNFTGICMLLDGSTNSMNLTYNTKSPRVSDVDFYGGIGAGGGGTGIKLYASGTHATESYKVTFASFQNIRILSFADGILLESGGDDGYVNDNIFNSVSLASCTRMITINGAGAYRVSANAFTNIHMQPSGASPVSDIGIKITGGDYNMFKAISFMDASEYDTAAIQVVSGLRNSIYGEGHSFYVIDTGLGTSIEGHYGPHVYHEGIAGDSLTKFNPVYLKTDGKYYHADADAATTMPAVGICMGTVTGGTPVSADASFMVVRQGRIYNSSWSWTTVGGYIYASTDPSTTNGLTETAPSGSGDQLQIVGQVLSATEIYVNPQLLLVEVA